MKKMKKRYVSPFIIGLMMLSGCAHLGTSILPYYVKKLYIVPFTNETFKQGLNEKLSNAVIEEFILEATLSPCQEKEADALLSGKITRYELEPLSYSEKMDIEEYKVRLIVDIAFKDLKEGEVFWEEEGLEVFVTATTASGGIEFKTEEEAIKEAIEKMARRIVKRVIHGW